MPYWKRQDVLSRNLARYRELYGDIEIIVVDDGSPEPAIVDDKTKLIQLPHKSYALNPCVPFNVGVEASSGDIIVLTNPEVIHRGPILDRMMTELTDDSYIAAACWNEDTKVWYCHTQGPEPSKMGRASIPPGAGLHFCSMLERGLWNTIGGFSEEYRHGQGYEDNDFLWKLHDAGARFLIMDDCVTDHIQCTRCEWTGPSNKVLFESKWSHFHT